MDQFASLPARLSAATALAQTFGYAAVSGAVHTFEFSGTAVLQLDKVGRVLRMNAQAEKLLGKGIRVVKRRLVAEHRADTDAIERALHAVIWDRGKPSLRAPVALSRAGRRPLLAYPLGLAGIADNPFADCRALLVLVDPARERRAPESVLRTVFNLTPAEARLASRLTNGEAIDTASDALKITKETARNQLKAVYAKTGVHRQAELVALLATFIGPLISI